MSSSSSCLQQFSRCIQRHSFSAAAVCSRRTRISSSFLQPKPQLYPYSYPHYHQHRWVQQLRKVFNNDAELNKLEEQAYGCADNGQIHRSLHVFNELINKQPLSAKYNFDYAMTVVKYYEQPSAALITDAQDRFRQAIHLCQSQDAYIIRSYAKLLSDGLFIDMDHKADEDARKECINEARNVYEGYIAEVQQESQKLQNKSHAEATAHTNTPNQRNDDRERDILIIPKETNSFFNNKIDIETLFAYAQLLDDDCHDYSEADHYFRKCIECASAEYQSKYFEVVNEYRIRYGFFLYKQQAFTDAIAEYSNALNAFHANVERSNLDPNENTPAEQILREKGATFFNTNLQKTQPRTYSHIFACMYLGVIYCDLGKLQMAKIYFNQLLRYKNQFYVKADMNMQLIILNECILFLIKSAEYKKAHEYWLQSYRLDKQISANTDPKNIKKNNYLGTNNIDILTIGAHLHSCTNNAKKADQYFVGIFDIIKNYISDENLSKYAYQNPYYFYGLHCLKTGKFENAKEILMKVCKMHPHFPEFLYQLSIACCHLKQFKESQLYLQQALNMNFSMIYPKYFAIKEEVFGDHVLIDISETKLALLEDETDADMSAIAGGLAPETEEKLEFDFDEEILEHNEDADADGDGDGPYRV